jgi:hypothetical protein
MDIRILTLLLPVMFALTAGSGRAQSEFPDRVRTGTRRTYWLDSTAFPGSSFIWSIDGMVMQSDTLCAFKHKWQHDGAYELSVELITRQGCRSDLITGRVIVEPEVKVSPNPVTGFEFNLTVFPDESSFAVIDLLSIGGQMEGRVFEGYLEGERPNLIRIRHTLKQGLYSYRIRMQDRILTGLLVIIPSY